MRTFKAFGFSETPIPTELHLEKLTAECAKPYVEIYLKVWPLIYYCMELLTRDREITGILSTDMMICSSLPLKKITLF